MSKKHIFLSIFSKIAIFVCVFCAFFISPVFASLPAGYTELEYIESSGTQYIDTGILHENLIVEYEALTTVTSSTSQILLATSASMNWIGWKNGYPSCGTDMTGVDATQKRKYKAIYTTSSIVLEDIATGTTKTTTNGSLSGTLRLFGWQNQYMSYTKLYACKMTSNNSLVANFIPAKRTSDSVIGMYDTVSNTFFTNAGTGEFIAGPEVVIKIATTKMVDEEFKAAEAKLATTVQTIESVVSRTITQTGQIATLQETKQTRPDENCPANMKCLLVQDEDGTPHWYPIIEP